MLLIVLSAADMLSRLDFKLAAKMLDHMSASVVAFCMVVVTLADRGPEFCFKVFLVAIGWA